MANPNKQPGNRWWHYADVADPQCISCEKFMSPKQLVCDCGVSQPGKRDTQKVEKHNETKKRKASETQLDDQLVDLWVKKH